MAKHAAAHAVLIELHGDRRSVTASVRDDGRGFDVQGSSKGGLAHMAERIGEVGGALSIRSDHATERPYAPRFRWPRGARAVRASTARRLAWSLFTATAALAAAQSVLVVSGSVGLVDAEAGLSLFPSSPSDACWARWLAPWSPCGSRETDRMAVPGGQLGTGIGLVSQAYASRVLQDACSARRWLSTRHRGGIGPRRQLGTRCARRGVPAVSGRVPAFAPVAPCCGPFRCRRSLSPEHRHRGADRLDHPGRGVEPAGIDRGRCIGPR